VSRARRRRRYWARRRARAAARADLAWFHAECDRLEGVLAEREAVLERLGLFGPAAILSQVTVQMQRLAELRARSDRGHADR